MLVTFHFAMGLVWPCRFGHCPALRKAARATRALNAGVSVRRVRRADIFNAPNSFKPGHSWSAFKRGIFNCRAVEFW